MIGKRFNRLVVLKDSGIRTKEQSKKWECLCNCGVTTLVVTRDLNSGNTQSCGCLQREKAKEIYSKCNITHGHSGKRTPTYRSWESLKQRCLNSNATKFNIYGGRGIMVCERWMIFENFLADMKERPEGTTIDRIDPDGHYELSNCRWATHLEQRHNRRCDHGKM